MHGGQVGSDFIQIHPELLPDCKSLLHSFVPFARQKVLKVVNHLEIDDVEVVSIKRRS